MLPFAPTDVPAARARLPRALDPVLDLRPGAAFRPAFRPGDTPANVFDFEDGLRLVVSREVLPGGTLDAEVVHVSASLFAGSVLFESLLALAPARRPAGFLAAARQRAAEVFDCPAAAWGDPLRLSAGCVPHWFLPVAVTRAAAGVPA